MKAYCDELEGDSQSRPYKACPVLTYECCHSSIFSAKKAIEEDANVVGCHLCRYPREHTEFTVGIDAV